MKKIISLMLALVITLSLSLVMAVPALAWTTYGSNVDISAGEVVNGQVQLTISEANSGSADIWNVSVTLKANDVTINTLTLYSPEFQGGNIYEPWANKLNGDGSAETWTWVLTVPVTGATLFEAIGYGEAWSSTGTVFVTPPEYPEEYACVTVEVGEGFTPGFWKNHLEAWEPTDYDPGDNFNSVFGVTNNLNTNLTLLEAVKMGGGGEKALMRHAVAALLNASHPNVDYFLTAGEVIAMVQDAYDSGDYEGAKDILAGYNELEGDINS